jgi:hypothetical protein
LTAKQRKKMLRNGQIIRWNMVRSVRRLLEVQMLAAMKMPFQPDLPVLRRVRAADTQSCAWHRPDGMDVCLDCWKRWISDPDKLTPLRTMTGLVGDGDGYSPDLYEQQGQQDMKIGEATNAMIDSLTTFHRWAIYASCSIASPWRFPNADVILVAVDARDELTKKLKKNACTGALF